ncbi:MAG TPA: LapA family protein [Thermomicrobiales bacterium]|nr:LapA family protein [Thermomicrobiales bacterium]
MSHQAADRDGSARGIRLTPKLVAFVVLLVLALIFASQNFEHVDVTVFFWEFHMRLVWALLGFALIGAILGWMVPRIRAGSRRR